MTPVQVIANPIAGRGRGAQVVPVVEQLLHTGGVEFELHRTEAPWHAAELARTAYQAGYRTIVTVGGDGTVNEVVNGLFQAGGAGSGVIATLGMIPIGSGNDFYYPFGLPASLEEACQRIVRAQTRIIDAGLVKADNEAPRYFVNGVGVGFDAVVNIESRKIQRLRGAAIYIVALLRTVAIYYSAPRVRVVYDGEVFESESLMLSVMNGRRFGGAFHMAPQALVDDGFFDLVLTRRLGRLGILRMIPEFMRGTHSRHTQVVQTARARHVVIDIDGTLPSHVDGEIYGVGARHYEMTILPQRLRVIC